MEWDLCQEEWSWRGGGGCSTWYEGDAVMDAGKYEEGARVGPGVTCEYMVGGVAVLAAADGGRS